jgi:hypothetical protein
MNKIVDLPRPLPRNARGKILPIVEMTDYGRHFQPRFYVQMHEIDGGWTSYEYVGNRHCDALDAIDRIKRERTIGDIDYEKGGSA